MAGDHVAPPGFLDVALQLDAERAVVPEAVEAAVDFARLKEEAAPFAQRDELVHVHVRKLPGHVVSAPCAAGRRCRTAATSTRSGSRRSSGTRANCVHARRRADVVIIAQLPQAGAPWLTSSAPSRHRPWCSKQSQASAGAVVEPASARRRTGTRPGRPASSVSSRATLAVVAGTDDVDRTRSRGAVVRRRRCRLTNAADQHPARPAAREQGPGAVGRGQHQGRAAAAPGGVLARRVAQVEARQRQAAALAAEQHLAGRHAVGQPAGLVHFGDRARPHAAAGREGVDDRRGGPQHVDDDGDAAGQSAGVEGGAEVDVDFPRAGHRSITAKFAAGRA